MTTEIATSHAAKPRTAGRWEPASKSVVPPAATAADGAAVPSAPDLGPAGKALADYTAAARRYLEVHGQWQAAVRRAAELRPQVEEAEQAMSVAEERWKHGLAGLVSTPIGEQPTPKRKGGRRKRMQAEGEPEPVEVEAGAA